MQLFSDEWYRSEWKKLGFHYELDHDSKQWKITGSREGVRSFVAAVRAYAIDSGNDWVSCHRNLGPHEYLEIGTWSSAIIDDHWIAGRLADLLDLATYVEEWIIASKAGDCLSVRSFFSPESPYDIWLRVGPDDFDPSSLDASLVTPLRC
ncbi:MAG: hypothetical protein ACREPD_09360 [Stenotrophomonas sp.]|uniref:hypothetical protein n=1 Tax=Gammaproteobacteria TaxID=1236 RepID=UPI003D6D4F6D